MCVLHKLLTPREVHGAAGAGKDTGIVACLSVVLEVYGGPYKTVSATGMCKRSRVNL